VEKYCTAREATDDSIIRCMRFACRINNNTDTHSEYVRVIIIAFPRQGWLCKRASMLRWYIYRGADKSLVGPKRKQVTAIEDFAVHVSYL
jgi:hypothetical protein